MVSDMTKNCVAEFVGTFLLVFTVGCNVLGKTPVWAGVSIASVLMVSIFALGKVSGGNFNPAVSVALGVSQQMGGPGMPWGKVGTYCGVQILAGIVAAFSYAFLFWDAFHLGPTKGFGVWQAGLCELLYTFMLCFVVLNVAGAKKWAQVGNEYYGLAIGFVVIAGAYGAGAVSGGCFNPAVAIGIDVSSQGFHIGWCLYYVFFELIGAALAAVLFKVVRPGDFVKPDCYDAGRPVQLGEKLTAEFLGTYMLVLTVGLNVLAGSPAGAFSIAASLMCMIYALGDISGANFNPAVTLAIIAWKSTAEEKKTGIQYMLAQFAGGILAAFTYSFIHHGKAFPLGPLPGYHWGDVACAEITFTFVLCYVVLATAVIDKTKSTDMFGLAIGSCVTVGGCAIGSISGGSLNPAVSLGIAVSNVSFKFLPAFLGYSCFEFIGAVAAAGIAKATHSAVKKAGGDDRLGA